MRHQQAISAELLASRVGKTIEVMVDRIDDDGVAARSHWDAPEIDGNVYLDGCLRTALGTGSRFSWKTRTNTTFMPGLFGASGGPRRHGARPGAPVWRAPASLPEAGKPARAATPGYAK